LLAVAIGAGLLYSHAQELFPLPAYDPPKSTSTPAPAPSQQQKPPAGSAPADQHTEGGKQEIANECANLLKMATDLKTEVDKTTKDTLSVTVVRKAGEIEQLAHKVRTGTGKS
jgi:type VI protein secretion system component VasF